MIECKQNLPPYSTHVLDMCGRNMTQQAWEKALEIVAAEGRVLVVHAGDLQDFMLQKRDW